MQRLRDIQAIVCRGGRTDLAGAAVGAIQAPTLLIVGAWDDVVLEANRETLIHLICPKRLEVISRATHLFEEPGAIEHVAELAAAWFTVHLKELPTAGAG